MHSQTESGNRTNLEIFVSSEIEEFNLRRRNKLQMDEAIISSECQKYILRPIPEDDVKTEPTDEYPGAPNDPILPNVEVDVKLEPVDDAY